MPQPCAAPGGGPPSRRRPGRPRNRPAGGRWGPAPAAGGPVAGSAAVPPGAGPRGAPPATACRRAPRCAGPGRTRGPGSDGASPGARCGVRPRVARERRDQADSSERPLRRRAARMARPARVRIRRRKPWVLARRRLLGWKVRLLTTTPVRQRGRMYRVRGRTPSASASRGRTPPDARAGPSTGDGCVGMRQWPVDRPDHGTARTLSGSNRLGRARHLAEPSSVAPAATPAAAATRRQGAPGSARHRPARCPDRLVDGRAELLRSRGDGENPARGAAPGYRSRC